jgi:hypothetical protein
MYTEKRNLFIKRVWLIVMIFVAAFLVSSVQSHAASNPKQIMKSPVKQGKYYYKVIKNKGIYRSKKKNANYKKIVSTNGKLEDNQGYILLDNLIIYTKKEGSYQVVYQCNLDGKKNKKLYSYQSSSEYVPEGFSAYYDKKLYYYVCDDPDRLGFCLDLRTNSYYQTGIIPFNQNGRYLACMNSGAGYYSISLFDAKKGTRKIFQNTEDAVAPTIIGKRIYYVQQISDGKYKVKSCDYNGKNRKTEGTIKKKNAYLYQITKLTKKYCYFNGKKIKY